MSVTTKWKSDAQPGWHRTCHFRAAVYAVMAHQTDFLHTMLTASPAGLGVCHFAPRGRLPGCDASDAFERSTSIPPATARVVTILGPGATRPPPRPPDIALGLQTLQQAYLISRGNSRLAVLRKGLPDAALHWLLGCEVQMAPMPQYELIPSVLLALMTRFERGESVVFLAAGHCAALVGVIYCCAGAEEQPAMVVRDPFQPRSLRVIGIESPLVRRWAGFCVTKGAHVLTASELVA